LAPRAAGIDVNTPVVDRDRGLHRDPIRREILLVEQAAIRPLELGEDPREVSAVDRVAHRRDAGLATPAARRLLLVDEKLQRPSEIRLKENLARLGRAAIRAEDRSGSRAGGEIGKLPLDCQRHHRVGDEPIAGVADGGADGVCEAHGAVQLERREPRVRSAGHDRLQNAFRHAVAADPLEELAARASRPCAETVDGHKAPFPPEIDHDRRDAGEAAHLRLDDIQREARRDAGVDGVAARLEDHQTRLRGEVMSGGDDVARARYQRAIGGSELVGAHRFLARQPPASRNRPSSGPCSCPERCSLLWTACQRWDWSAAPCIGRIRKRRCRIRPDRALGRLRRKLRRASAMNDPALPSC
jgi:hypothetical protein